LAWRENQKGVWARISLFERLSLAPGSSPVNPVIIGIKPVSKGFPCAQKPLKRLPDGLRQSSIGLKPVLMKFFGSVQKSRCARRLEIDKLLLTISGPVA
jgi:hypothetical protein